MMEDYLLPQRLPEKFKNNFLKNTLKLGEVATFEGFIVSLPNAKILKNEIWGKLSPLIGDFDIKGITPFPDKGFPVLPIIVPYYVRSRGRVAEIEGKIYDFSIFTNIRGRFVLVESWKNRKVEEYMIKEKTGLNGSKIYRIFDSSLADASRDLLLSYFLSSSMYLNRVGGCTITLLDALSKYYSSDFREIENLLRALPQILKKNSMKITLLYDDEMEINVSPSFRIKYGVMDRKEAIKFYSTRKSREWEKSAITKSDIKQENLIGYAELPFIAYQEETGVYDKEIIDYSIDLASYVVEQHLQMPEINEDYIERFKIRFLERMQSNFPLLSEAMRMGILIDMANVNGFGEHLGRLVNSWERLNYLNPQEKTMDVYTLLFERIEDVMGDVIKKKLSALEEKRRIERILNRVLWELNTLKPEGWDYFYFERKANERGIENVEKLFNQLYREGIIIERSRGRFIAVSSL